MRTPTRRTRGPATPEQRALAEEVARYINQRTGRAQRVHPLDGLVHILIAFPEIDLETALTGFVFRSVLDRPVLQ